VRSCNHFGSERVISVTCLAELFDADRQTDMKKLRAALLNFAKVHKNFFVYDN
jgi:hypothetical protein